MLDTGRLFYKAAFFRWCQKKPPVQGGAYIKKGCFQLLRNPQTGGDRQKQMCVMGGEGVSLSVSRKAALSLLTFFSSFCQVYLTVFLNVYSE